MNEIKIKSENYAEEVGVYIPQGLILINGYWVENE